MVEEREEDLSQKEILERTKEATAFLDIDRGKKLVKMMNDDTYEQYVLWEHFTSGSESCIGGCKKCQEYEDKYIED